MGVQQNKISYLEEFSRAASEAHWGLFSVQDERSMEEISYNRSERETLAIGANMPLPPMYRGSTKKEKRKVMDIYMAYDRCVRVLNASTGSRVFLMPKSEVDITEEDWLYYFLSAQICEKDDCEKLDRDARHLSMDTNLQDADSRVMRLLADYMRILDMHDLEMFTISEPKMAVLTSVEGVYISRIRLTDFSSCLGYLK
ncbi:unnamed protein product [Albugo candida]|uniref:Uncharacterized protein n=1 Tax=Albugo candida TaxID=65357 RepID=A0A024FWW2_9STRA|nr:unnamed protein product [Albugo candida]|eukprot:CCI11605.1 unnamed protein product [Albugo candida]